MTDVTIIDNYIKENMFYTEKWDEVYMEKKQVVVNNAEAILYRELSHHFKAETEGKEIPIDVLAEQCLHVLERDDSHRRAEMGVSYFMASGLYLSFDKNFKDWTIAPTILKRYPRRRTGRYTVDKTDTFRR
ncbi:hypothetical protein QFZ31_006669 [Neobacillus niacini]|uniref:hypothetical protein n=1 Tax=Neobacillus driksii TaxID=3035913 RepID=UPI002787615B|nr:hypothetical protein [Neobacillus niacini]MDQ0976617.1 hypothetical protein [Neobacillus niacini]